MAMEETTGPVCLEFQPFEKSKTLLDLHNRTRQFLLDEVPLERSRNCSYENVR